MARQMQASPNELIATADWLGVSADEFDAEVTQFMRQVRGLVGADWRGVAADSHNDAWTEWEDGARHVIAGLRQDAGALRKTAAELSRTDDRHAADIGRVERGMA